MSATRKPDAPFNWRWPDFTNADYDRRLAAQAGVCAIRGCGATGKTRRLNIDHEHGTNPKRVRGLLCHRCNRMLPVWVTPDYLRALADYLDYA